MALSNLQANVVSSVRQRKHGSSESLVAPPSSTPTTLRPQGQAFKAPTASVLVIEPSTLRCTQRPLCCTPCPDSLVLLLQMMSFEMSNDSHYHTVLESPGHVQYAWLRHEPRLLAALLQAGF